MKTKVLLILGAAFLTQLFVVSTATASEYFSFTNGKLERPTGYRERVYVGTPVTPNDMNDGKAAFPAFHNVYIDPKSWS